MRITTSLRKLDHLPLFPFINTVFRSSTSVKALHPRFISLQNQTSLQQQILLYIDHGQ